MEFIKKIGLVAASLFSLFWTQNLWAYGCIQTDVNGTCFKWDNSEAITWNPEGGCLKCSADASEPDPENGTGTSSSSSGGCELVGGDVVSKALELNHDDSVQLIQDQFDKWTSVTGVDLTVSQGSTLDDGGNTNVSNYTNFYAITGSETFVANCYDNDSSTECVNPLIFDRSGAIIDDLVGSCARYSILGVAGFVSQTDDDGNAETIQMGQGLFSGVCLDPADTTVASCSSGCSSSISLDDISTVILHELGHFLGMDHTQVNKASYIQCENTNGGCSTALKEDIPTMFPVLVTGATQSTLHRDDQVGIQHLYPASGASNISSTHCTLTGNVAFSGNSTDLRCAEIVVRNQDDDTVDSISFISGAESPRNTASGRTQSNCTSNCGAYTIKGLEVGETYNIEIQSLLSSWTGGSSIEPCDPPASNFAEKLDSGTGVAGTVTCNSAGQTISQDLTTNTQ